MWLLAAYRQTHSPGRLTWSKGQRPLGAVPHSSYEPGELSQWLCYNDSTINIIMLIIIIITGIIMHVITEDSCDCDCVSDTDGGECAGREVVDARSRCVYIRQVGSSCPHHYHRLCPALPRSVCSLVCECQCQY